MDGERTPDDPGGLGSDLAGGVPDLSVLTRIEGELAAVQQALGRLDEGSYGTCRACGAPIGDDRLEADPVAALCAQHARG